MSVNPTNICNCINYDQTVYSVASEVPCKYDRRTAEYVLIAGAWRPSVEYFYLGTTLVFSWRFTYDANGNVIEKIIS